ncbi:MAG: iron-sulfur cluster assembly scaffold protein [Firmicutes bacterium]|nr:iron-sulfur cluster assembly scaffold protein [Bacillota bacterium]
MYSDETLERFKAVKNMGKIADADAIGEVGNVYCGDIMRLYLKIDKVKDIILDAKFKTFGCVAAIVSMDMACEKLKGLTLDEALKITNRDVLSLMGANIPKQKIHCSVMAQESIEAAIKTYRGEPFTPHDHHH